MAQTGMGPWVQLAAALREARSRSGMSQEQLARLSNKSTGFVGLVERGKRRPRSQVLKHWARLLDIPEAELLGPADYMPAEADDGIPPGVLASVRRMVRAGLGERSFRELEEFAARYLLRLPEDADEGGGQDGTGRAKGHAHQERDQDEGRATPEHKPTGRKQNARVRFALGA
jgi:transcriptional regulator with XRE-family HTH domain